MISTIRSAWSWAGLDPAEIVATNAFGNYIVRATDGTYWRICPEEPSCKKIADNELGYLAVLGNEEFITDWEMQPLVESAVKKFGAQPSDRCFCLKMPAVLGGEYDAHNIGTIARKELISFAGDIAEQVKDVPDGAKIEIKIIGNGG